MPKFKPLSENEAKAQASSLLPIGEYPCEVLDGVSLGDKYIATENTVSKKGSDMIVMVMRVFDDNGGFKNIWDYLLLEGVTAYKLRHAAAAFGLLDKYESGEISAEDFIGKTGTVKIGIKKDKDGQYPDKNEVKDYITKDNSQIPAQRTITKIPVHDDLEDNIPF